MNGLRTITVCSALLLSSGLSLAAPPKAAPSTPPEWSDLVPRNLRWVGKLESFEMFSTLLSGGPLDGGYGWFHPSQGLYGWKWLESHYDSNHDGVITRKEFPGAPELFDRLDRDGNGDLTEADFDWSEQSPLVRQERLVHGVFRRLDSDGNGAISEEEWQKMFRKAAAGKKELTRRDLQRLLFPPTQPTLKKSGPSGEPTPMALIKGFATGELGSVFEGPRLGQQAPDFRLPTQDGSDTISLGQFRGKRPVVLVFGSFT
jgi:Ca2+-binding EF-hand superfamily protein